MSESPAALADHPQPTLEEIRAWPATCSIPQACQALGVSQSHGYDLARRGEFPAKVIMMGGAYRVATWSLLALLTGENGAA